MEHQCSKCGRPFHPGSKDTDICTACLEAEFTNTGKTNVDTTFREEIVATLDEVRKKQHDRAQVMNQSYNSGTHFTSSGRVNVIVAGFLLIVCIFGLLINDHSNNTSAIISLNAEYMRIFSMAFCILAAGFVYKASIRHKKLFRFVALGIVVFGWFAPNLSQMIKSSLPVDSNDSAEAIADAQKRNVPAVRGRLLNEADLETLRLRRNQSHNSVYAFFINEADPLQRSNLLDAIARLTTASYKALYSKKRGYLIIIETPTRQMSDLSAVAKRFGNIHYSNVDEGVYEINYDSDISRMTNNYSPEAINTPSHPSFVNANIEELQSKIPDRIYQAAVALNTANTPLLRIDIVDTILEVLEDSWRTEPQTHTALVNTLITYSAPNNERTAEEAKKLFDINQVNGIQTPTNIVDYLLAVRGDEMTDTVIKLWMENPIVWHNQLEKLGDGTEKKLLDILAETRDLQLIGNILKYLKQYGTKEAIPYIEKLESHPDSLVSRTAKSTIAEINTRL